MINHKIVLFTFSNTSLGLFSKQQHKTNSLCNFIWRLCS